MNIDWVREHCLALPHTTEKIQWVDDLVFKIGGKMYAIVVLEPAQVWMSFKSSPEEFAELVEQEGIIPAPYMARAQWVALTSECRLPPTEIKRLLTRAYGLVFAKLAKKTQVALRAKPARKRKARKLNR